MKVKTSELIGPALDWAVAKCERWAVSVDEFLKTQLANSKFAYSTVWAKGGPIVEREKIGTLWEARNVWSASTKWDDPAKVFYGKTKLIAAMRCYVASKLGEEIEIPEELR